MKLQSIKTETEATRMERKEELEESIQEYREMRLNDRRGFIESRYKEMVPAFCAKLDQLMLEQKHRQETGEQKQIKHIFVLRLRSSNYTESYELAIGMSNALLYLDKQMSFAYWNPKPVFDSIETDLAEADKFLRRRSLYLDKNELFHLKQQLLDDDWQAFQSVLPAIVKEVESIVLNNPLKMEKEVQVLCGDYMDLVTFVCEIKEEGEADQ